MSKVEFRIEYDGPALEDHVMDVSVLAPSLLAFNDMCREASRRLYDDQAYVQVNVATTSEGCFGADLQLIVEMLQNIKDSPALEVAYALERFWRFIRPRIRRAEAEDSEEKVQGTSFDRNLRSDGLVHLHMQMAYWQFVSPLHVDGIEEIRISLNGKHVETIRKEDIEDGYYHVPPHVYGGDSLPSSYVQALLRLRAMTVEKDEKWQFTYGEARIGATIRDAAFLARVLAGEERPGLNDYFQVHMRITQTLLNNGEIQNTYEIIRVWVTFPGEK